MDACDHDEQPDQLEQVIIGAMAGKHLVTAGEIAKAIRTSGVALGDDEHPNAADYRNQAERAEAECAELRADKVRLDYLDRCNAALNARYGTTYRWKLIQSHNVNRLMIGDFAVDLHDSHPHGLPSCRDAIDERMREAKECRP